MNLRAIDSGRFALPTPASVDDSAFAHLRFPDLNAIELVFVNGQFMPDLSGDLSVGEGVTITTFANADAAAVDVIASQLDTLAPTQSEPFVALNAAAFTDGVLVHVARGVVYERPIRVMNINVDAEKATLTCPRVLIVAEESSEVTVIEDFGATTGVDGYISNGVTEIHVGPNAEVRHYFIEREAPNAMSFNSRSASIDRDARLKSHSIMFGGAVVRNDILPKIVGTGADCLLNGVYIGEGDQQIDTHVRLNHTEPNCTSNQYFRGVLSGKSRGNFTGRIVVDRAAQKTDAVQSSQNLLLSDDARAHSKPQLEIFADDVRCTHGATIGQLDHDSLFYLKSRGMSENIARSLLVYAFASEGIDLMQLDPIKNVVKDMLVSRLPDAAAIRDVF